jgi:NTE family protein
MIENFALTNSRLRLTMRYRTRLPRGDYVRPFVHRIGGGNLLAPFPASSKLDASWSLISNLYGFGREAAKQRLDETYYAIGRKGTVSLRMTYTAIAAFNALA